MPLGRGSSAVRSATCARALGGPVSTPRTLRTRQLAPPLRSPRARSLWANRAVIGVGLRQILTHNPRVRQRSSGKGREHSTDEEGLIVLGLKILDRVIRGFVSFCFRCFRLDDRRSRIARLFRSNLTGNTKPLRCARRKSTNAFESESVQSPRVNKTLCCMRARERKRESVAGNTFTQKEIYFRFLLPTRPPRAFSIRTPSALHKK